MKVSIITVCYNSGVTIKDTIESVINQDYELIEYIIVDGNSSDDTLEIVETYKNQITKIISEPDKGFYEAVNKGIEMTTGDVVGLINSDDMLASNDVISKIVNKFKSNNCDAVYSDLQYVAKDNTNKVVRNWISGKYKKGDFLYGWMPPHPTFYVKRGKYVELGSYNLELASADYELMLRFIHKYKISLGYLEAVTVKMRVGGTSNVTLSNRIIANKEDRKAWVLNNLVPKFYTLCFKPLRKLKQFL